MAGRTLSMGADDRFVEELDRAVQRCQREHPYASYTRSAFMKSAIRRAVAEVNAQYAEQPRVRTRERAGAAV